MNYDYDSLFILLLLLFLLLSTKVNPELLKRREYLFRKQQEREYNQMTFGTDAYVNISVD